MSKSKKQGGIQKELFRVWNEAAAAIAEQARRLVEDAAIELAPKGCVAEIQACLLMAVANELSDAAQTSKTPRLEAWLKEAATPLALVPPSTEH